MRKFILSATLFCLFISCNDNNNEAIEINDTNCQAQVTESHLPSWLDTKKAELQKDDYKAQIDLLTYSWGTAIFINPCTQCADFYTYIYDNCGVEVCSTGGIAGTTTCTDKYLEESQKTLLWKE